MRAAIKLLIAYEACGLLTLAVWLHALPLPWTGPYSKIAATIVFGPCVFLGWPSYWWSIYQIGDWPW